MLVHIIADFTLEIGYCVCWRLAFVTETQYLISSTMFNKVLCWNTYYSICACMELYTNKTPAFPPNLIIQWIEVD